SGDLYQVTKPSTTHIVFLSTSASTWCQRLSHSGDEVLRSLVSRQFISCNKEKSTDICHACQLSKHLKLLFHSSDSIVEHCFDITHSDLWTSPVARLVANGSSQQLGVDFDETFRPVVKPATIRTVFSIVVSRQWPIHQLDVKNAFLNDDLSETVYIHQPPSFVDSRYPHHVFLLQRSLQGSQVAYLLIYVNDIILTASYPVALQQIIYSLHNEFDMTDLGKLNYFLGISATRTPTSLFLSQKKYALQLLEPAHMLNINTLSLAPVPNAEYRGVANVVAEIAWFRNLLRELNYPLSTATLIYCDNVSAIYMSANPIQHQRMKHIEINIHFVRDMVTAGQVRVLQVPSRYQHAGIFTKGLPSALFKDFRSSLSVRPPLAQTARAY
nr:ribonuclease H-like domain-containing protein [Tanacetum cinerariifolium]